MRVLIVIWSVFIVVSHATYPPNVPALPAAPPVYPAPAPPPSPVHRYPPVSAPVIEVNNDTPPQQNLPKSLDPGLKEILHILPIIHKIERLTDSYGTSGDQGSNRGFHSGQMQGYGTPMSQGASPPQGYGSAMQPQPQPQQSRYGRPMMMVPPPHREYGRPQMDQNSYQQMMSGGGYPPQTAMSGLGTQLEGGTVIPIGYAHISIPRTNNPAQMPFNNQGYGGQMSSGSGYGPGSNGQQASNGQNSFNKFTMISNGQAGRAYGPAPSIPASNGRYGTQASDPKKTVIKVSLKPNLSQKGQYPTISYTISTSGKNKQMNGGNGQLQYPPVSVPAPRPEMRYANTNGGPAPNRAGGYGNGQSSSSGQSGYGSGNSGSSQSGYGSMYGGGNIYDVCESGMNMDGFCAGKYAGLYSHPNPRCFIQCDQFQHHTSNLCAPGTAWFRSGVEPSSVNQCMHSNLGLQGIH